MHVLLLALRKHILPKRNAASEDGLLILINGLTPDDLDWFSHKIEITFQAKMELGKTRPGGKAWSHLGNRMLKCRLLNCVRVGGELLV